MGHRARTIGLLLVLVLIGAPFPLLPLISEQASAAEAGPTQRVSVGSDGTEGNSNSGVADISADGRYVAFQSTASNLVPGDTNGVLDVFVRDREAGTSRRVSLSSNGMQGNGVSGAPSISADGRFVTFISAATNLVADDTNGSQDVFLHDRADGTTIRISVTSAGHQGGGHSFSPMISGDGRYIAYTTYSELEFGGAGSGLVGVYRYDRMDGSVEPVCIRMTDGRATRLCIAPAISDDGRYVAFESSVRLVSGDTNPWTDIYLRDFAAGTTTLLSMAPGGAQASSSSSAPSIAGDGSAVAFSSHAKNLVADDTNGTIDVFVRDLTTATTTRASVSSTGAQALSGSFTRSCNCASHALSRDGRYVVFYSFGSNLVDDDANNTADVFVHDRRAGVTTRASLTATGAEANSFSGIAVISADGMFVAFESFASNLVPGDTNRVFDVFVRSLAANTPPGVSVPADLEIYLHDGLDVWGSFSDPDPGQTWTATVDYSDGAGSIPLELEDDGTFRLVHAFRDFGTGQVRVEVTDSAGAVGVGVFSVNVMPKRAILYVHGTTGTSAQGLARNDFPSLFSRLFDEYELVRFFEYYEDRANALSETDRSCRAGLQRRVPTIAAPAYMPPLFTDAPPGICDSNDDIEVNAILLDEDIRALARDFDRVTILSNSGGARITRAYLAYAYAAGTGSLNMVDAVVTMQGVHAGTYIAAVYDGLDQLVDADPEAAAVRDALLDTVRPAVAHDPERPAFDDLRPMSASARYTNAVVPLPDQPHYVNVLGNVRVDIHASILLVPFVTQTIEFGDLVILPGEDDPRALPERGGARFLPALADHGRSSTEWELVRDLDVNFDPSILGVVILEQLARIVEAPEAHQNFGAQLDRMCVRDGSGAVRRLDEALFEAIRALDSGLAPDPTRIGFGRSLSVGCP